MEVIKKEMQMKEVVVDHYSLCDYCDERIEERGDNNPFEVFSFEIVYRSGDCYPEGCVGEKETVELCKPCADVFMDGLRKAGYRVNEEDL